MEAIKATEAILLASASPRRLESLERLGFPVTVAPADIDESVLDHLPLGERVVSLAGLKARVGAERAPASPSPRYVLGADTLVGLDGRAFGKPRDLAEAREMLGALAGRTHVVYSGLAALDRLSGRVETGLAETEVTFAPMNQAEIAWYLSSGEWRGVAGAYRIQELAALFIRRIEGSFSGVVGLPLHTFYDILSRIGYPFPFGRGAD